MSFLSGRLSWILGGAAAAVALVAIALLTHLPWIFIGLMVLILALAVAIVLLVLQLKRSAAAEEIERTITTQADADIERSTAGQLAEAQQLKENLLAAIAQLKSSSRRGGADALAKLPWYMLIGPAQAGKSELVKRSGLEFPLKETTGDPRAVRGVGGTRGFSWWLSSDAVLLDMAGKTLATAAFDDSGDWVAFLETLRRQRPEKPINGAIVVVAVDQIADQPEARIDSVARATRERLQELVQHLGVVFPVYVVFNRVDRVSGFGEFFENLAPVERRQAWGATLSMERARAHPADQLFDEEFGVLLGALSERRMPRMAAMGEAGARARAFAFPLQLERVRGSLRRYLRTLFETQTDAEPPLFRGFYLAAATQSGEPEDRVLQPAVRSLGLTLRPPEPVERATGGAWFVRDLFTEIVFPDATLATTSRGARGQLRRTELMQVAAWGLAALILSMVFIGFSCSNGAVVDRAKRAAVEVSNNVTDEAALVDNLRTLDHLRAAADELDRIHRHVPFGRRLGGWAGDGARDPAVDLWMRKMTRYVLKPAAARLEDELRARVAGGKGAFPEDYYRFRVWRLITDPRQIDVEDSPIIAREVTRVLHDRLSLGGTDAAGRTAYPALVDRQVQFLARNPNDLARVVHENDAVPSTDRALVASMASIVHAEWNPRAFYDELIGIAGRRRKPLTFGDLAGETPLMGGSASVPGPFTREGWEGEVHPGAEWYARLVGRDAVMADAFGGRPPDLRRDLLGFYAEDVTKHWVAFLDGVDYTPQSTLGGVDDQLARLAKGDSPIFKLLRGTRDELAGLAVPGTPLEGVAHDFRLLSEFFAAPGTLAQRTKDVLGELTRRLPGQSGPSTIRESLDAQYMRFLGKAQKDVKDLGPGAPLDQLQQLLSPPPDKTNGVFELVSFADGLASSYSDTPSGPVIGRLLRAPVDAARRLVSERGLGPRVAQAWQGLFLQRFNQDLAGHYPFTAGGPDASPEAFAACFGPQGYFWAFYTQYLAPFVNPDGTAKGQGAPPVSGGMLEFLRKANAIRSAFFAVGASPSVAFTVSASQPEFDPGILVRWVAFDCGGQTATYTMGMAQDQPLQWPGQDPQAIAAIRAQAAPPEDPKHKRKKNQPDAIAVEPVSGTGLWSLFRLLDRAATLSTSGGTTRATWNLTAAGGSRIAATWEMKVTTGDSPFARNFLRLSPPSTP